MEIMIPDILSIICIGVMIGALVIAIVKKIMITYALIFANFVPFLLKRINNNRSYLILSTIIVGCAFIMMGFTTFLPLSILLIFVVGAFGYPRWLIYVNGINKQIESENRATVLSTVNMFQSFIGAIIYVPLVQYV